jgi:16S rRNA (uracil1498-N3)-methyltransferase
MHRFYIPPASWSATPLELSAEESHHCVEVLRLQPESRIVVFDGQGNEIIAEIVATDRRRVQLQPVIYSKAPRLRCAITLAQAVPKGKNMEFIVQKATELGVSRIVPLLSERTVVQFDAEEAARKREKWRQVVIEAAKQCGQNWLPELSVAISPKKFFAGFDQVEFPLIASLQPGSQTIKSALTAFSRHHGRLPKSALILIGPEGDFTPAEAALALSSGCIPVSLGPIVLRTETAAVYTLSVLSHELQGPT